MNNYKRFSVVLAVVLAVTFAFAAVVAALFCAAPEYVLPAKKTGTTETNKPSDNNDVLITVEFLLNDEVNGKGVNVFIDNKPTFSVTVKEGDALLEKLPTGKRITTSNNDEYSFYAWFYDGKPIAASDKVTRDKFPEAFETGKIQVQAKCQKNWTDFY